MRNSIRALATFLFFTLAILHVSKAQVPIEGVLTPGDRYNLEVDTKARWDAIAGMKNNYAVPAPKFPTHTNTSHPYIGQPKVIYSNGNKFKVYKYVWTDLDGNIVNTLDLKKTTFNIDTNKKMFIMKMGGIYYEHYFYNKVERFSTASETKDVYSIYNSYSSEKKGWRIEVLSLEVNPTTNELLNYQQYYGKKGVITFYLTPIK
jgi:hypothetical protein